MSIIAFQDFLSPRCFISSPFIHEPFLESIPLSFIEFLSFSSSPASLSRVPWALAMLPYLALSLMCLPCLSNEAETVINGIPWMFTDVDTDETECLSQSWRHHILAILCLLLWQMDDWRCFTWRGPTHSVRPPPSSLFGHHPSFPPQVYSIRVWSQPIFDHIPLGTWEVRALHYLVTGKGRKVLRGKARPPCW